MPAEPCEAGHAEFRSLHPLGYRATNRNQGLGPCGRPVRLLGWAALRPPHRVFNVVSNLGPEHKIWTGGGGGSFGYRVVLGPPGLTVGLEAEARLRGISPESRITWAHLPS